MLKIPFFRLGKWKHPLYGEVNITQQTFSEIISNFKSNVLGRPPFVRIGHDKGNAPMFGYAPAEGWVVDIKQEGNILFGEVVPTTPEAEENIKTKRYRFSSAEYTPSGTDKETGNKVGAVLSAIALTNEPFLTKLPEATLLSEKPDLFFMDFAEIKGGIPGMDSNESKLDAIIQKLSDFINHFKPQEKPKQDELKAKLAEVELQLAKMSEIQNQINLLKETNKSLSEQVANETGKRKLAEVEKQAAEMISSGIYPAMVEQWKALALSEGGNSLVKLSDGKGGEVEISQAEAMKNMLLALPVESRIKFDQSGSQSKPKPEDELKLSCKADIIALGGTIDEKTGKYLI